MQTTAEWTTTTTPADVASRLRSAKHVAVVTHQKPDGDAIGSTLSVVLALQHANPQTDITLVYAGSMPTWASEILGDQPWLHIAEEGSINLGKRPELCIVFDTGTRQQIGADMTRWIEGDPASTIIVDHHKQGDPDLASDRIVSTSSAAVCEVSAQICCALLNTKSSAELPKDIATAIYLGLATDTGWFKYSNVTATTLHLAADLIDAGVDHAALFDTVEAQDRINRYQLMGRSFSSLESVFDGQVTVQRITADDFAQTDALESELNGFSAIPLMVKTARVSVLLTQSPAKPSQTKVSLRSKPGKYAVDVSAIASSLGGGGHARAAGARLDMPINEAKQTVLNAIKPHLSSLASHA
ncbi:MAG: DHH family phosphoesterase [Phycisphaeraceae bacterium]|nr:DHH family phosphoesterase [Phycisphaerales bacterium]MCB9860463.1 DHH family phosphoesterase [Phycisphaeraceae bacterium]